MCTNVAGTTLMENVANPPSRLPKRVSRNSPPEENGSTFPQM